MSRQVLIVEDDAALGQLLADDLRHSGMSPTLPFFDERVWSAR